MKKLLTRVLTVIAGVSTLLALVSCDKLFSSTEKPVEIPEQKLEQLNQTFRSAVASAMQEAAGLAKVRLQTDNFTAIVLDDGNSVVMNGVIAGVENLTLEQLAQGADVLFTFLPQGSALPSGFYIVRFLRRETQWKAQFKDLEGKVILEADAEVNEEDPALRQKDGVTSVIIIATGDVIIVLIDIHPLPWSARVGVTLANGGTNPLNPYPQIMQATQKFYQDARSIIMRSLEVAGGQSVFGRQLMIGTRNDVLLVHTVFQGIEKLTLDDLAKGQDVFLRYIHYSPPHPMMPSGFAVVHILRNPAGQWVAQIRDLQGKPILELPATVEIIGQAGSFTDPLLTLGLSEDTEYGVVLPQGIRINIVYKDREHGAYGDLETPEQKLKKAQEEFRSTVVSEMQKAAAEAGIKVRTDNYIALPVDDSTVFVNTMVEGYDQLTIEQLARGVDAMFIFSSAYLSAAGKEIDPGFYVVHISQNPDGKWVAQLRNLEGRVVLEVDAYVEQADPSAAKMQPMCTIGPRGELILFDQHDTWKNIYVEVSFRGIEKKDIRRGMVIIAASKSIRQAARDYLLAQDFPPDFQETIRKANVIPVIPGQFPRPLNWYVMNCGTAKKPEWCACVLREEHRNPYYAIWECHGLYNNKIYFFFIY